MSQCTYLTKKKKKKKISLKTFFKVVNRCSHSNFKGQTVPRFRCRGNKITVRQGS